ncbi:VWA domain-containing protein [Candidatus Pacearchaeota archaeon]|nr:VWA domain-containing protein [Candidatus Pacearchaeota archaeon]
MSVTFVRPFYLALLAVIPLIIFVHFFTLKQKKSRAIRFANFDAIARIRGIELLSKNITVLSMTIAVILLMTLSLSGTRIERTLFSSESSYIIAIDTSRSMSADDLPPNRLEVAKDSAMDFIESVPAGTRIGIISFSGNAFIENDITNDKNLLKQSVSSIPLSSIGGSDLSEAVITSANLLRNEEAKSVILLSDGRINIGTIDEAIDYANENAIFVHTVGIGTEEGGTTSYGFSRIDEEALMALAHNTESRYFRAMDESSLKESFSEILELKLKKVSFDLTNYLTLAGLLLFVIEYILLNTRYRVIP